MKFKLTFAAAVCGVLVLAMVTLLRSRAQSLNPPQVVMHQLASENGIVPVEITKPVVPFESNKQVGNISFAVKNNTNKNIRSVCMAFTIRLLRGSVQSSDTFYQTFETYVNSDLQNSGRLRPILPGGEVTITDNGSMSYEDENIITAVESSIDYVEFDDATTLGRNVKGQVLIGRIRDGAAKYKDLLRQRCKAEANCPSAIERIVMSEEIPGELTLPASEQKLGARLYRDYVRRLWEDGPASREEFVQITMWNKTAK